MRAMERMTSMLSRRRFVLTLLATAGTFFALGRAFRTAPIPAITPTQPIENLGLDFAICRVMSMSISVAGVPGHAYVGVRVAHGSSKYLFFDAALIARATFTESVRSAEIGLAKFNPAQITRIPIDQARDMGIYPMPN